MRGGGRGRVGGWVSGRVVTASTLFPAKGSGAALHGHNTTKASSIPVGEDVAGKHLQLETVKLREQGKVGQGKQEGAHACQSRARQGCGR